MAVTIIKKAPKKGPPKVITVYRNKGTTPTSNPSILKRMGEQH